ncbi:MAG: response regulator [Chloroflexi bacterium]|nr:response regulator [Chloroflexota bacterium]
MKKILIVEDEPDILDILRLTLDFDDYRLLTATTGDDALELAVKETPDLVLLDIMLPGKFDGYEICKYLRSNEATRGAYVIMVTAKGMERDIIEGRIAGCDEYIVKPFKINTLLKRIKKVLG